MKHEIDARSLPSSTATQGARSFVGRDPFFNKKRREKVVATCRPNGWPVPGRSTSVPARSARRVGGLIDIGAKAKRAIL